jgi:gas vesicle protein
MGMMRTGARAAAGIAGGIVALAVLYTIGALVFSSAAWITAPFRGESDKRENTVGSGAFRQSTYQEFFDLCEAAQNAEGSIQALKEERRTASEARETQIDQSITALKSSRIEAINDYNSKAAQEHRAPFRDRSLPFRLNAVERTTCTKQSPVSWEGSGYS